MSDSSTLHGGREWMSHSSNPNDTDKARVYGCAGLFRYPGQQTLHRGPAGSAAAEGQPQPSHAYLERWMQIPPLTKLFWGGGSGGSDSNPALRQPSVPVSSRARDKAASSACPCLTNPSSEQFGPSLGVQVILREAPIPLLPARHCFLASEALLALCDPESRIPAFHGFPRTTAYPRQLVPVAACIESAPGHPERGPPGRRLRLIIPPPNSEYPHHCRRSTPRRAEHCDARRH
ncbi:uncharacterized protein M421DRAFT_3352 [Didymella exigua CBS 183.55]|uniref:Uncharacterized protein n=1 Tax=Didymella exigua CBS 183.55 TaxID=1150837 RepID=A0A6A5RPC0_9PLEO|nr:uncharacterized protein M421DRAFT_3352 [Didymella exigua CBS 183.55]KAF1930271.1 hypothetical protein M421DRAFT_3352 [Didymella exigua CBS 183.55]